MEILLGLIAALVGGLLFYRRKANEAAVENKLIETKAKDQALVEQQQDVEKAIATLDAGIEKMKKEREAEERKRIEDNMSLKERADRIKKGLQ